MPRFPTAILRGTRRRSHPDERPLVQQPLSQVDAAPKELATEGSCPLFQLPLIPTELLMTIFDHAYLRLRRPKSRFSLTMSLSHVSKAWRTAALQDSLLWTSIVLDEQHHKCKFLVRMFLERAGATRPLDLLICLQSAAPTSSGYDQFYRQDNLAVTNALKLLYAVAPRWQSMTLIGGGMQARLHEILSRAQGQLAQLRSIHLASVWKTQMQLHWPIFGSDAPSLPALRVLRLSGVRLKGAHLRQPFPPALAGLETLEFSSEASSSAFSAPRLCDIAGVCQGITRLSLGGVVPQLWPQTVPNVAPLTLPNLEFLQISLPVSQAAALLDEITTPQLHTLELGPLTFAGWQGFLEHLSQAGRRYERLTALHLREMPLGVNDAITPAMAAYLDLLEQQAPDHPLPPGNPPGVVQPWPELYAATPALVSLSLEDTPVARMLLGIVEATAELPAGGPTRCWPELRELRLGGQNLTQARASIIMPLVETRIRAHVPLSTIYIEDAWAESLTAEVIEWLRRRVEVKRIPA